MSEVLITLRNLNESHPVTVGEFRWNESVKRHLMQGRPLSIAEFNAFMQSPEWDRSIERNGERLRIEVREGIDPQVDALKARVSELEALDLGWSHSWGLLAIILFGEQNNVTDAKVIEAVKALKSQDGQVAKSSGSYPGDAGAIPAPATNSLLEAAANASPPPKSRRRDQTRTHSRKRAKQG